MNRLFRNALVVLGVAIVLTAGTLGLVLAPDEAPAAVVAPPGADVLVAARAIVAGNRIGQGDLRLRRARC